MNGSEVRTRIVELNEEMSKNISPAVFVLNKKTQKIQEEIRYLREVCPHEYDELGYCIYCDKKKA